MCHLCGLCHEYPYYCHVGDVVMCCSHVKYRILNGGWQVARSWAVYWDLESFGSGLQFAFSSTVA